MMNILFEDNHLLVVEKPVNIPMCEDSSFDEDLLSIAKKYIKEKYSKPGNVYLGLVHRLDRPVGGIVVFAKTSKAAGRLCDEIRKKTFKKTYLAVVEDNGLKNEDTFKDFLLKDEKTNRVSVNPKGKEAILHYTVLKRKDNLALVKIQLETGRPHQIRVQFSSRNHALYGDQRYNPHALVGQQIALFAFELTFEHPTTKEVLHFHLEPEREPFNL